MVQYFILVAAFVRIFIAATIHRSVQPCNGIDCVLTESVVLELIAQSTDCSLSKQEKTKQKSLVAINGKSENLITKRMLYSHGWPSFSSISFSSRTSASSRSKFLIALAFRSIAISTSNLSSSSLNISSAYTEKF